MHLYLNTEKLSALNRFWDMGVNTCHVPPWLRGDLSSDLGRMRQDLHFQYVCAHGIPNDDMVTVRHDGTVDYVLCIAMSKSACPRKMNFARHNNLKAVHLTRTRKTL